MFSEVLTSKRRICRPLQKNAAFDTEHFEPLLKVLSIKEKKFWYFYVLGEMAREFRLKMAKKSIFWKIKIK